MSYCLKFSADAPLPYVTLGKVVYSCKTQEECPGLSMCYKGVCVPAVPTPNYKMCTNDSECEVNRYEICKFGACMIPYELIDDPRLPTTTPPPSTPTPVTPEPSTPTPVTPAPSTPTPVTPEPSTPTPVTPAPSTPTPVTPEPSTPTPVTPEPSTPTPVTPEPSTPTPVTPEPSTPTPVTPAPTPPPSGACSSHADCSNTTLCENMKCVDAEPTDKACSDSQPCDSAQVCRNGLCWKKYEAPIEGRCETHANCPGHELCVENSCKMSVAAHDCTEDKDCQKGAFCKNEKCWKVGCLKHDDCEGATLCNAKQTCQQAKRFGGRCLTDTNCGNNAACKLGFCWTFV
ncbi:hypothetical protein TTRE_0000576101 [Trichuris trichiura]|uniref:DUF7107 domain-containing protein n=1 Tax=Trichuris trichiura TaxID=36087 RepID=A0A077ZC89_TRITR|nr:hypothetical protein TTRE_0000576101 [Trichuris trichiura]